MSKKISAVEWLVEQLDTLIEYYPSQFEQVNKAFEQAKAMEEAEKDKQYQRGYKDGSKHIKIIYNL